MHTRTSVAVLVVLALLIVAAMFYAGAGAFPGAGGAAASPRMSVGPREGYLVYPYLDLDEPGERGSYYAMTASG